jgi:hypothetical protein
MLECGINIFYSLDHQLVVLNRRDGHAVAVTHGSNMSPNHNASDLQKVACQTASVSNPLSLYADPDPAF